MVGGLFIDLCALLVNGRGNALRYGCHHPVADSDFGTNAKRHPISGPVVASRTRLALSRQDFLRWPARSLHLMISVVRPQTPGPLIAPLARRHGSRRSLASAGSVRYRILRDPGNRRPQRPQRDVIPSVTSVSSCSRSLGRWPRCPRFRKESRWKTVRFPTPLGFDRIFPLSHSRSRRKNVRLLSQNQAIPAMARPALNVPRPSPRRKNDCRRFRRAVR